MSEIKFKTEWLTQIALLAACGTADDVADLCTAIQRASLDLPINEMSSLTETLFHPIAESINEIKTKSERNRTNRQRKSNENERPLEEEKREKEEKNQKKKESKREEYITDASVDNTNVLSPSLSCSEPEKSASEPAEQPVITLPLNDGTEHPVTTADIAEYSSLYPSVDVLQELRNMRGWILGKPERRKTKRGIRAFITTWLSKEQDRGPKPVARSGTINRKLTAEELFNVPAIRRGG